MDRRGTWIWSDVLYWFFYLPLTAFVIIALVSVPGRVLSQMLVAMPLDAAIFEERMINKVTKLSPVYGVEHGVLSDDFNLNSRLVLSSKRFGYRVSYQAGNSGEEVFGNKLFYEQAIPLAPIKYDRFNSSRMMVKGSVDAKFVVDQVYPRSYGAFS